MAVVKDGHPKDGEQYERVLDEQLQELSVHNEELYAEKGLLETQLQETQETLKVSAPHLRPQPHPCPGGAV